MKKTGNNNLLLYLFYVIAFVSMFGIMLCCPMINDDYSFLSYGLKSFSDVFRFSLYYGNGRLIGNITSLLLVQSPIAFAAEKAVILFAIVALLPKILSFGEKKENEAVMFLTSFILMMGMTPYIFQEVITWSTCFQNYVPPVAGLIICMLMVKSRKSNPIIMFLIFVVGFTSQLYLELNTLVNVLFGFVIAVLCFVKYRDRMAKAITYFVSSVLGAAVMFAIPKLFVDPERQRVMEGYRGFHIGSISDIIHTVINNTIVLTTPMKKSIILLVILSVVMCITLYLSDKKKGYRFIAQCSILFMPLFHIVFQIYLDNKAFVDTKYYRYFCIMILGLFAFGAFLCIGCMEKCIEKFIAAVSACFVFVSLAPVLIVTPARPRCSYLYYMFLTVLTLTMVSYLLKKKKLPDGFNIAVLICAAVLTLNLGLNYINVRSEAAKQTASIEAQMKEHFEVIKVEEIDNLYMHKTSDKMFGYYYYYEKPFDVKFEYTK